MDEWFGLLVLFCGLFLQLSLQMPNAVERVKKMHPIRGSWERMDKASWIFIIVGSLWEIQNLLV